jgi:hypothetical protein
MLKLPYARAGYQEPSGFAAMSEADVPPPPSWGRKSLDLADPITATTVTIRMAQVAL